MRFSEYFKNSAKPILSFELYPPKTDRGMHSLKSRVIPRLIDLDPSYITVTYGAGGSTQGQTLEIASYIMNECNLESACHLTCVGASRDEIDAVIHRTVDAGIENIVALRGDAPQGDAEFVAHEDGFSHANELIDHADPAVKAQRRAAIAGTPMVGQAAQAQEAPNHIVAPHLWNGLSEVRVNCGTAIVGTPEQVTDLLLDYWKLGVDEFILSGFPHVEECQRVAADVLPLLRQKMAAA